MVTTPPLTPPTTPVEPTVAIPGLLLVHTPPGVASASGIVVPVQTSVGPVIVPALADKLTVTTTEVAHVPNE